MMMLNRIPLDELSVIIPIDFEYLKAFLKKLMDCYSDLSN